MFAGRVCGRGAQQRDGPGVLLRPSGQEDHLCAHQSGPRGGEPRQPQQGKHLGILSKYL